MEESTSVHRAKDPRDGFFVRLDPGGGYLRLFLISSAVLLAVVAGLGLALRRLGYLSVDQVGWFASVGAFHAVGLPYVVAIALLSLNRSPRDLDALAPILQVPPKKLADLRRSLLTPPRAVLWFSLACTFIVPMALAQFEDSIWSRALRGGVESIPWLALCGLSLLHWVAGVFAAGILVFTSATFHSLGRRSVEVDVFRPEDTEPFARVGTRNGLFVLGLFAIFPLMWVARPLAAPDLSASPFAFAVAIAGTFLPMHGVRLAMRAAKRRKLEELDSQIRRTRDASPREVEKFANLADLLTVREAVLAAREWPLSSQTLERLLFYFLLPLISWVCGALVEQYVDRLLGGGGA